MFLGSSIYLLSLRYGDLYLGKRWGLVNKIWRFISGASVLYIDSFPHCQLLVRANSINKTEDFCLLKIGINSSISFVAAMFKHTSYKRQVQEPS